jgi:hypothetical protein
MLEPWFWRDDSGMGTWESLVIGGWLADVKDSSLSPQPYWDGLSMGIRVDLLPVSLGRVSLKRKPLRSLHRLVA